MATLDNANTLEAHVEKIVLAVCALIAIFAFSYWVISSPRSIENLPPSKVDQSLADKAAAAERHVKDANIKLPALPRYDILLSSLQQAPAAEAMVDLAIGNPPLEVNANIGTPPIYPDLAELISKIPPILKTEAAGDFRIPKKDKTPVEIVGADLQVAFPIVKLQQDWENSRLKYSDRTIKKPVILSVEMEYQEAEPGKPWSKPQTFKSDGPAIAGPDGKALVIPALPKYDGTNDAEVAKAVDAIASTDVQNAIMHPPYYEVLGPGGQGWQPHRIKLPPAAQESVAAWAFRDNLSPDKFYRYRMRLHLLNPLYGNKKFLDPKKCEANPQYVMANAGVASIATDWSAWSGPVGVPRTTQFFLVGSNPIRGWVRVAVMTRHMGNQVIESFNVSPGQMIGGPVRSTGKQPTTIDYSTGAVIISVDFNKTVYKKGVPTRTAEMIYLSQDNKLKSRLLAVDEREFKELAPEPKVAAPPAGLPARPAPKGPPAPDVPPAPAGGGWKPAAG
ncbi:MAG: hypothetical protein ABFD92_01840 [Planctomycetaceae bacterium]|nr:hypothetical protein [Planctomycetaceae bacterium]